ncbi:MAG: hypothetical protein QM606_01920, partial [Leucobacter sp.]
MRFQKTVVTLLAGALILAPATSAVAAETEVGSQAVIDPRAQDDPSQIEADAQADVVEEQQPPVDVEVAISGEPLVGQELAVDDRSEKPADLTAATTDYSWYADDQLLAEGERYTVQPTDLGKRLKVVADVAWEANRVREAGAVQGASVETAAVAKQQAPVQIGAVKISGAVVVGKPL